MKIKLQQGGNEHFIQWSNWNLMLHGRAIDDRGQRVIDVLSGKVAEKKSLEYCPDRLEMSLNDSHITVDEFTESLEPYKGGRILLETTTLGFVEIVICCKALRQLGYESFDLVYLEPDLYQRQMRTHLLKRRDFELSLQVPGFRAIPGSALLLGDRRPVRSIFFVGYEESRLRRAFEELQMLSNYNRRAAVVFGVPAYKAGWEMDAMANNIPVITEFGIRGGVHFCGAANPLEVIELLTALYQGLEPQERLVVAPIGTKPHGIGVALFASLRDDVGVLYDHSAPAAGRTSDFGSWHLFTVNDFFDVK